MSTVECWTWYEHRCASLSECSPKPSLSSQVLSRSPDVSASGETVSRIYNLALSGDSKNAHSLDGDHVWSAFYLHALMLDSERRLQPLHLPHHGMQSDRFRSALALRNVRMAGIGQPHWSHACDECERIIPPADPTQPPSTSACFVLSSFL